MWARFMAGWPTTSLAVFIRSAILSTREDGLTRGSSSFCGRQLDCCGPEHLCPSPQEPSCRFGPGSLAGTGLVGLTEDICGIRPELEFITNAQRRWTAGPTSHENTAKEFDAVPFKRGKRRAAANPKQKRIRRRAGARTTTTRRRRAARTARRSRVLATIVASLGTYSPCAARR